MSSHTSDTADTRRAPFRLLVAWVLTVGLYWGSRDVLHVSELVYLLPCHVVTGYLAWRCRSLGLAIVGSGAQYPCGFGVRWLVSLYQGQTHLQFGHMDGYALIALFLIMLTMASGIVVSSLTYGAFVVVSNWRIPSDRPRGLCGTCNYCLRGNLSGICPECGTPIPKEQKGMITGREEMPLDIRDSSASLGRRS